MQLKDILKQYSLTMQFISNYKLAGVIPLDIFLHVVVGYIIYYTLLKFFKKNHILSFIILFCIELIKEIFDSFSLTNQIIENVTDFIATMLIPTILVVINKNNNKNRLN